MNEGKVHATKENEIPSECNRLECSVDDLIGKISDLESRLASVLHTEEPEVAGDPKESNCNCELASFIRSKRLKISSQNERLASLLSRIEL